MTETRKEVNEDANQEQTIESGVVLYLNENNMPSMRIIGEVGLLEMTAFKRLLEINEGKVWDASTMEEEEKGDEQ